jgi:hypothetical protein
VTGAPNAAREARPEAAPEPPRAPELPFSGESPRPEPERSAPTEAPRPEGKYVVWSSAPSDSSPHGPGRDD